MLPVCLLVLTALGCGAQSSDYCGISPRHTACRHRGVGPGCGRPGERGLADREMEEVVDYHNRLRSRVARGVTGQPPAADMRQVLWDDELALVAQRLADQCNFAHDCSDCRRVQRFAVGQNLYQSFTTQMRETVNWRKAVDSWYDEISQFPASSVARYQFSPETGHYSQLVWAATDRIGCGVTQYASGSFVARLYVCNYGQGGNLIGAPVYTQGRACSSCPSACSPAYPGLCTNTTSSASTPTLSRPVTAGRPQQQRPSRPSVSQGPSEFPVPSVSQGPSVSLPRPTRPQPRPCTSLLCLLSRPGAAIMDTIHSTQHSVMDTIHSAMDSIGTGFRFPSLPIRFP